MVHGQARVSTVINVVDKDPDELVQFDMRSTSPQVAGWNKGAYLFSFTHTPAYNTKGNLSDVSLSLTRRPSVMALASNGPQGGLGEYFLMEY